MKRRHAYWHNCGQATLEYLLVGLVLVIAASGVSVLWRYVASDSFAQTAAGTASHSMDSAGGVADALMY